MQHAMSYHLPNYRRILRLDLRKEGQVLRFIISELGTLLIQKAWLITLFRQSYLWTLRPRGLSTKGPITTTM